MREAFNLSDCQLMKQRFFLSFLLVCFLVTLPSQIHAAKTSPKSEYGKAVKEMDRFMDNESKKKYRSNWETRLGSFEGIAQKYPKSAEADNALLKAGEGYLALYQYSRKDKDIDKASQLFQKILKTYPKSDSADEALFKVGEVYFNYEQDPSAALDQFRTLLKKYPKSSLAKDAKKIAQKIAVQLEQEKESKTEGKRTKTTDKDRTKKAPADETAIDGRKAESIAAHPIEEPPVLRGLSHVKSIRHWSNNSYTRVVVNMDNNVSFDKSRLFKPDRLYFDLHNARLDSTFEKKPLEINDGILKSARIGQFTSDTVRLVLDLDDFQTYQIFPMENPSRLVIDIVAKGGSMPLEEAPSTKSDEAQKGAEKTPQEAKKAKPSWALRNWAKAPASPPDTPSLARQLGLGVRRIVIDAGHGGNDPGAVGPTGLKEKDVVLDIALRLEKLVKANISNDVILTRKDDTFIHLEERTAIANKNKADLFVSIHANASRNKNTRGIETYLLNLTSNKEAIEVAARENQASMKTMSDMGGILKDIMRTAKKDESLHLAHSVQKELVGGLSDNHDGIQNLGVKEAPFYVLIGAQMPSILAEVGFISNAAEEQRFATEEFRQEVAEALLNGIKSYVNSISHKVAEAGGANE